MNIEYNKVDLSKPLSSTIIRNIMDLDAKIFPWPWTTSAWDKFLMSHREISLFMASNDGLVASFALFETFDGDNLAHLYKIVVSEKFQGTGVASQLHHYSVSSMLKADISNIYLEVDTSNLRAISFYKKCGYQPIHIKKKFYENGSDAQVMMLSVVTN